MRFPNCSITQTLSCLSSWSVSIFFKLFFLICILKKKYVLSTPCPFNFVCVCKISRGIKRKFKESFITEEFKIYLLNLLMQDHHNILNQKNTPPPLYKFSASTISLISWHTFPVPFPCVFPGLFWIFCFDASSLKIRDSIEEWIKENWGGVDHSVLSLVFL